MVFIPPPIATRLNAYLTTSLSPEDLAKVKRSFECGACSRFDPLLELVIKDEPSYRGRSHAAIRRAEDAEGRTDGFVIIDERAAADDAVWYVDAFASVDDVRNEIAQSTSTVIQILIKTLCLSEAWMNYDIGNMSIIEDLGNIGVEFPIIEEFEQEIPLDCGLGELEHQCDHDAYITAEPGEFEESTEEELRKKISPKPKKVARLKADVAKENGLVSDWTIPWAASPMKLPDGTEKTFPEGTVVFKCSYDPDFPWPDYKWPDGSL